MLNAKECKEIAIAVAESKADDIIKKMLTKVDSRIKEESESGAMFYTYSCDQCLTVVRDKVVEKIIEAVKPYEDEEIGFIISIDDRGNGYWSDLKVTFSWSGDLKKANGFGKTEHLYHTPDELERILMKTE